MSETSPTKEELKKLPRWACVAFAARCARRVQPLFTKHWPDAAVEDVQAVEADITLAEKFAKDTSAAHAQALTYANAKAASNAASAAHAAYALPVGVPTQDATTSATVSALAAANAASAAAHAANAPTCVPNTLRAAARLDFEHLLVTAQDESWDDQTPVDVDTLGPCWPDGPSRLAA